ncbi:MAG: IS110 family transposase, partial [Myxococcota bacterium]
MAKQVEERILGVDVAKSWLDIYDAVSGESTRIDNNEAAVVAWLKARPDLFKVAVEATNRYHELFIEQAHA